MVEGNRVIMVTPELAGVSVSDVGLVVTNAVERHHEVRRAIDILTEIFDPLLLAASDIRDKFRQITVLKTDE